MIKKLVLILFFGFINYGHIFSNDKLPSIKEICTGLKYEIRDLELMKKNLKKEFKNIDNEIEQFGLLPELTKDVNNTIKQQIFQAKLYHYLDCSRFD